MATKISFVSLGCDKNLIDSEIMLGLIDEKGYIITSYAPYINQFYYVNDIDIPERKEKDGPVFSQMDKYINTGEWGIAIFGKKHCWHNIQEDLKII